ncbi:multiheme c-type cytochrome [Hydrogenimonas sp.]
MIRISFTLLFAASLFASGGFVKSKVCSKCHPTIYKEYMGSMHRNSSVENDPVHKAVWDKHPLKAKQKYNCAVCHTPTDTKLVEAFKKGEPALPEANAIQRDEPIGCATCHRIRSIRTHTKQNENLYNDKPKYYYAAKNGKTLDKTVEFHETSSFFGLSKKTAGSPFHTIDYSNKLFANGYICLGCHDHKRNKQGFAICDIQRKKAAPSEKRNCITCHMPQVKGSLSTISETKTHAYHGFAGVHVRPDLLAKSIGLKAEKRGNGIVVTVKNEADHRLFSHPLRLGQLQVSIDRDGKTLELKPVDFFTMLGHKGKPAMPWVATEVLKENGIGAKETRTFAFDATLRKGDRVTVTLGYYIVNPKAAKKLGITDESLSEFKVLKSQTFAF